jgi:hypothetical protein
LDSVSDDARDVYFESSLVYDADTGNFSGHFMHDLHQVRLLKSNQGHPSKIARSIHVQTACVSRQASLKGWTPITMPSCSASEDLPPANAGPSTPATSHQKIDMSTGIPCPVRQPCPVSIPSLCPAACQHATDKQRSSEAGEWEQVDEELASAGMAGMATKKMRMGTSGQADGSHADGKPSPSVQRAGNTPQWCTQSRKGGNFVHTKGSSKGGLTPSTVTQHANVAQSFGIVLCSRQQGDTKGRRSERMSSKASIQDDEGSGVCIQKVNSAKRKRRRGQQPAGALVQLGMQGGQTCTDMHQLKPSCGPTEIGSWLKSKPSDEGCCALNSGEALATPCAWLSSEDRFGSLSGQALCNRDEAVDPVNQAAKVIRGAALLSRQQTPTADSGLNGERAIGLILGLQGGERRESLVQKQVGNAVKLRGGKDGSMACRSVELCERPLGKIVSQKVVKGTDAEAKICSGEAAAPEISLERRRARGSPPLEAEIAASHQGRGEEGTQACHRFLGKSCVSNVQLKKSTTAHKLHERQCGRGWNKNGEGKLKVTQSGLGATLRLLRESTEHGGLLDRRSSKSI